MPDLQPFHLLLNLALGGEATPFTVTNGVGITEAQLQARLADPVANPAQVSGQAGLAGGLLRN